MQVILLREHNIIIDVVLNSESGRSREETYNRQVVARPGSTV